MKTETTAPAVPEVGNPQREFVQPPWYADPDGQPVTLRLDDPPAARTITVGHGLYYVHRDGQGMTILNRGQYLQREYPRIPAPERGVIRALLVHALGELDAMDAADGGTGTVRG